jgi:para-aminobenzoate synthetase component I
MRQSATYQISDIELFKNQLVFWASQFNRFSVLKGTRNKQQGLYLKYDMLVAIDSISEISPQKDSFQALKSYSDNCKDWLFGHFSYDLKNELEVLESNNKDHILFPKLHFFQPKWVFTFTDSEVTIHFPESLPRNEMHSVFKEISKIQRDDASNQYASQVKKRVSKEEYFSVFEKLQDHISNGNIYEINYCQEYYIENIELNALGLFESLNQISPSPFSAFYRMDDKYLMCSSPERFLTKIGNKLISQPIKGTSKRGVNEIEDAQLKKALFEDPKERSENVMIVDLVRNDLSKSAQKASVKVDELFGIYSFEHVHQMISTVVSELKEDVHFIDAIKYAFPMGSMTGAPKIRAMQLIEEFEKTKRGLYSGSVGFIDPKGDFDFNVVIRSVNYNSSNKYASFMVGGAITAKANAQQEYEECELKAKAILQLFND